MVDLSCFLARSRGRFNLDEPCVRDGVEYFSDGHVLVWRASDKAPTTTGNFPRHESVTFNPDDYDGWRALPAVPDACREQVASCPHCNGQGYLYCPECRHENDCRKCHGFGNVIEAERPFAQIAGTFFDSIRLHRIAGLPEAQYVIDGGGRLLIRWRDGCAILASADPEEDERKAAIVIAAEEVADDAR